MLSAAAEQRDGAERKVKAAPRCYFHLLILHTVRQRHYSRSAIMVNAVDLASNKDTDFAVLPSLLVGQEVWDQQSQT